MYIGGGGLGRKGGVVRGVAKGTAPPPEKEVGPEGREQEVWLGEVLKGWPPPEKEVGPERTENGWVWIGEGEMLK